MRRNRFYTASLIGLSVGLLALSACGDEPPVEYPEFSELDVICGQSEDDDTGLIVESVQVHVTDPNRNLVSVQGTINSLVVTLKDPDADLYFTWSPPESADPLACSGDFLVSLEAVDSEGTSTQFFETVSK